MKKIFVDGSCSRNPGHVIAYGYVVYNHDGSKYSDCNGIIETDGNIALKAMSMTAEAVALSKSLEYAVLNLDEDEISFFTDSLTVANVVNGLTLPRDGRNYALVIEDIMKTIEILENTGTKVRVFHIKRVHNKEADKLSKTAHHNFLKYDMGF